MLYIYKRFVGIFMEIQNQQSANQSINQSKQQNQEPNYVCMI